MNEPHDTPNPPADTPRRPEREYEDPHYHDDYELPAEESGPPRRPALRIPPPRRPHHDDD
jgi:hypothetical protein